MELDWTIVIMEPIRVILREVGERIPSLAGALFILIIGWLIAKAIRTVVTKALKIIRFDIAGGKAGISNTLVKGGIKYTPAELVGILVYWLVMLIVFAIAINTLGLEIATEMFKEILFYLPHVIAAIFVLVLGMFLASFVAGIVRTAASNAGIEQAKILGDSTKYIIVILTAIVVLKQLGIATEVPAHAFLIILGGICLALSLAFGLGCKEIAGDFIRRFLSKYTKQE